MRAATGLAAVVNGTIGPIGTPTTVTAPLPCLLRWVPRAPRPPGGRRGGSVRAWSVASSASRTSTASPARCAASGGSAPTRWPATCSGGWCRGAAPRNVFLANGARLYLDVGSHPEYATPECDSILDLVTHDKAGERILEQLLVSAEARLREEGIRGVIYLFKNNTDSAGNTYGCHENYLTSRRDDFSHYAEVLIPFFVSRQIYAGAGKVLQTARGAMYCIAQRAEHIWEGVSSATTRSRPDHQHPRRAPRRRRALPAAARHRGRLEHERVRHVPQGGGHVDPAAHAGGPLVRAAGHDAGEPDPGHPRDQPRPHLQAHRAAGQRPRGLGARHPGRVPRAGQALRRDQGPVAAGGEGAGHVGVLPQRAGVRPVQARPRVRLGDQAQADRGLQRQARPAAQPPQGGAHRPAVPRRQPRAGPVLPAAASATWSSG